MDRDWSKDPLKVVTTFSGMDAQCLALERLKDNFPSFNYELLAWSEIDKYAIEAHNILFPQWSDRNLGDVTKVDWKALNERIGDLDLLTCSSPCTDISSAGKLEGMEKGSGTRSSLIWEYPRMIQSLKPKYSILENVIGLVGKRFRKQFDELVELIREEGYSCDWKVMNAKDYGIPQNRKRVFLVCIREDCSDKSFRFPDPIPYKDQLIDLVEKDVEDRYYLSEGMVEKFFKHNETRLGGFAFKPREIEEGVIASCLRAKTPDGHTDNMFIEYEK